MRFQALDKLINLHDGYRRRFKIDHLQLLLLQEDAQRYLVEAACPHRGHSLESASIADGCLRCPLHGYRFRLADGIVVQALEEPCRPLRVFELVYQGNEVGVMLAD
jgi:nitrite reductase/ring-hydroxylating ferredoxin subunit